MLVGATTSHRTELLAIHTLDEVREFHVLFLELNIETLNALEVAHPILELFVEVPDP